MLLQPSPLCLTVLVAARNEEANMEKCLSSLTPASRVIVLDSQSTDRTTQVAINAVAEVAQFEYAGGYPKKRQWALDTLPITTEWGLLIDAKVLKMRPITDAEATSVENSTLRRFS